MATLYLTEPGAIVCKRDERLLVRQGSTVITEIPAIKVERILIFGPGHLTTPAVHFALRHGIDVAYLSRNGRFRGHLRTSLTGDGGARQRQSQRLLDPDFRLAVSKRIVAGKIANAASLCRRQRRRPRKVERSLQALQQLHRQVERTEGMDELRGHEGAAAARYYRAYAEFLHPTWSFSHRRYRPAPDPVNALLSLGYVLLYERLIGLITLHGLDPYQGAFHALKRGHAALASDLLEEWRAPIVDSLVLTVLKRQDLRADHFRSRGARQGTRLTREGLGRFLRRFDATLERKVKHPTLSRRMSYHACMDEQVRQFKRVLFGEASRYVPFAIKE